MGDTFEADTSMLAADDEDGDAAEGDAPEAEPVPDDDNAAGRAVTAGGEDLSTAADSDAEHSH